MVRSFSSTGRRLGPVLLVDDYDDARVSVRESLEDAGYGVLEAGNGQQALNLLVSRRDEPVALIIVDLQMPVMDGWRLLELLRCYVNLSSIPVIITTAQEPRLAQVRHRHVIGCLRAPYQLQQLVEMVDACLDATAETSARAPIATSRDG